MKFAVVLLGGAGLIVFGYEAGVMPVAAAGTLVVGVGVWWAKLSPGRRR
jgi:hypothetical protein